MPSMKDLFSNLPSYKSPAELMTRAVPLLLSPIQSTLLLKVPESTVPSALVIFASP